MRVSLIAPRVCVETCLLFTHPLLVHSNAQIPPSYEEGGKPWVHPCDIALPCAIENDILASHAHELVANGCQLVVEGASMPSHDDAVKVFRAAGMDYAPAKAASAGGAVVSGLEMAQNAQFMQWTREQVCVATVACLRACVGVCVHARVWCVCVCVCVQETKARATSTHACRPLSGG